MAPCIVSSNNGLVFNILFSLILAFSWIKSAIFFYGFLKFSSIFDICPFSSARKPIQRSDKKLLHGCLFQWICFHQFKLSNL